MIGTLIFSKDSPTRLEVLLRSITLNANDVFGRVIVLYSTSSDSSRKGYEIMSKEFESVTWVPISNLKQDVLSSIEAAGASSICFLSDWDMIFSNISGKAVEIESILDDQTVLCFSLRLGENVTKCYLMGINNRLYGQVPVGESSIKFDWKKHYLDFANPFSINGHIYRTPEIQKMLRKVTFNSPEEIEDSLHLFQDYPKNMMASFVKSAVVTVPKLEMMSMVKNRKEKPSVINESELTKLFLEGKRIDLSMIDFSSVNSCYMEVELHLSPCG
jgi:hypothetical protein